MIGTALKVFSIAEDVYRQLVDAGIEMDSVEVCPGATEGGFRERICVHVRRPGGRVTLEAACGVLGLTKRKYKAYGRTKAVAGNVQVVGYFGDMRIKLYTGAS